MAAEPKTPDSDLVGDEGSTDSPPVLDDAGFDRLLALARLEVDADQRRALAGDFSELLGFVATLFEARLDAPDGTPDERHAIGRPDVVTPSLVSAAALANAPETQDGFFRVPRTVEET